MKFLSQIIILLIFTSFVKAQDRSIIGDYWLGVRNSFATFEGGTQNIVSFAGNLPFHQNISIGLGMGFGLADYDNGLEADLVEGTFSLLVHNKVKSSSDVSVDPYVSLALAFYSADLNILNHKTTVIPIELEFGSEFVFSDFFALTPYLSIASYIHDGGYDADTFFSFGLNGDFLISDHFSVGLGLEGDTDSEFTFHINSRVHF